MAAGQTPNPMDPDAFREWGGQVIDMAADYWASLRDTKVQPDIKPLELYNMLPHSAPETPQSLDDIIADTKSLILPNTTKWHHPHFYAYYTSANSYPAIAGDIVSSAIACLGFTWDSSPACTELEMVVMDWTAKAIHLPDHFLFSHAGPGGGLILGTASESIQIALLAARSNVLRSKKLKNIDCRVENLVAYASDQAHSSVERAAHLGAVRHSSIVTNEHFTLRGIDLRTGIENDLKCGLTPFFVCASLGTTPQCAFDNLKEIAEVCKEFNLWLHVDAAYAGSAFMCPEYTHYLEGVENADTFNFNPHKWMSVNFDCSMMWYKDTRLVEQSFDVDAVYLQHDRHETVPDFRHWQVPLGRRFRSLKVWYTLRAFGLENLRTIIRNMIKLAHEFEDQIKLNEEFEVVFPVLMGLVCFRLKGENDKTEKLLRLLNEDGRIHLVPSKLHEVFVLRLSISSTQTTSEDIKFAYSVICENAKKVLEGHLGAQAYL